MQDASLDPKQLISESNLRETSEMIRKMKADGKTIHEVRNTHFEFSRKFPSLVDKLMQDNVDETQLEYIFNMFGKVKTNPNTFKKTSEKVGLDVYEKFLAPTLTPEQRKSVADRMESLQKQSPEELAKAVAKLARESGRQSNTNSRHHKTRMNNTSTAPAQKKKSKLPSSPSNNNNNKKDTK